MIGSFFLSLREGVSFIPQAADQAVLQYGPWAATFSRLSPGALTALQQLANTGEYEDRLAEIVLKPDGTEALAKFYYSLRHLSQWRLLRRSVHLNGERLATLVPVSFYFEYVSRSIVPDRRYLLSRFAYTRAEEGKTMLEAPLSHARIILHDWRGANLVPAPAPAR